MLLQICHYMIHAFIIARIVFPYKLSVFYFLIFSKLSFHVKILKHTNLINLCLLVINKKKKMFLVLQQAQVVVEQLGINWDENFMTKHIYHFQPVLLAGYNKAPCYWIERALTSWLRCFKQFFFFLKSGNNYILCVRDTQGHIS